MDYILENIYINFKGDLSIVILKLSPIYKIVVLKSYFNPKFKILIPNKYIYIYIINPIN